MNFKTQARYLISRVLCGGALAAGTFVSLRASLYFDAEFYCEQVENEI